MNNVCRNHESNAGEQINDHIGTGADGNGIGRYPIVYLTDQNLDKGHKERHEKLNDPLVQQISCIFICKNIPFCDICKYFA